MFITSSGNHRFLKCLCWLLLVSLVLGLAGLVGIAGLVAVLIKFWNLVAPVLEALAVFVAAIILGLFTVSWLATVAFKPWLCRCK